LHDTEALTPLGGNAFAIGAAGFKHGVGGPDLAIDQRIAR
jgi:hypothetical protein